MEMELLDGEDDFLLDPDDEDDEDLEIELNEED